MHEINVTPFIDVMLVLLHHLHGGGTAFYRRSTHQICPRPARPRPSRRDKPIYVTIKANLGLAIGDPAVDRLNLVHTLDTMPDAGKDRRILLRRAAAAASGELMSVLERLRVGGYRRSLARCTGKTAALDLLQIHDWRNR